MTGNRFRHVAVAGIVASLSVTLHAANNLNPARSVCLDLRGASDANAQGVCQSADSECTGGPLPDGILHCTDNDHDPLNGGICVPQACFDPGDAVVVDVELGPTDMPACGGQMFVEWDVAALQFDALETDPEGELGWSFILVNGVDEKEGTVDLALALPIGLICDDTTGAFDGGTIARLRFTAIDERETFGVRFRESQFPTAIGGPQGTIPIVGCNDEPDPSPTDPMSTEFGCDGLFGDGDADGDVDVMDFAMFLDCTCGPEGEAEDDCAPFDFDEDEDVDWTDAGYFQRAVMVPPPGPNPGGR